MKRVHVHGDQPTGSLGLGIAPPAPFGKGHENLAADLIVVLSADHIYTLDLRDVIDRHQETRASVTMVNTVINVP